MNQRFVSLILLILGISGVAVCYPFPSAHAVIWIGGHITSNTTWTPADTYRVINDVYVDPSVTLTILAGVHVQFADGFSLIVQGSLSATGTDAEPIVFTSSRLTPSPGAWDTIEFVGNGQFLLKNAEIEYAVHGVRVQSLAPAVIEKCTISNCSQSGIMMVGENNNVVIRENTIKDNWDGIATDPATGHSGITMMNNMIISNNNNGIYIPALSPDRSHYTIYNLTLASNTVLSNGKDGIYIHNYGGDIYNVTFSSNIVSSNSGDGIHLSCASALELCYIHNVSVASNTVSSNEMSGIHVNGCFHSQFAYDITVSTNTVLANHQNGIWIEGWIFSNDPIKANIYNNSISSNNCGVCYASGSTNNQAHYNDIYSNTYGMNVTEGASVNAENNYWGDANGPYHTSVNPEGHGNPVNGNGVDLDFVPFLTSSAVPEFPSFLILALFMISTLLTATFHKKKGEKR